MKRETPIELRLVLKAYIECALWASTDEQGKSFDHFDETDLSADALESLTADCRDFLALADEYLTNDWFDSQIGHDFWLTRNGHGCGFWDRGLPNGDELTQCAKTYGTCDLYLGDDGKIHLY